MLYLAEVLTDPKPDSTDSTDKEKPLYVDVEVQPQGYVIKKVQFPRTAGNYMQPQKGSLVLIFKIDNFTARIVSILKDPVNTSGELINKLRGEGTSGLENFKPGEIQLQSNKKSFLYLDNNGSAKLSSADMSQQFVADIGAQTARVKGINVLLGNLSSSAFISMDQDGNLVIQSSTATAVPVEQASIKIAPTGKITIDSSISDVEITSRTGNITINAAQNVNVNATGDVNVKGKSIKLGNLLFKKLITSDFLNSFIFHTHPVVGTVAGPTTTPVAGVTTTTTEAE